MRDPFDPHSPSLPPEDPAGVRRWPDWGAVLLVAGLVVLAIVGVFWSGAPASPSIPYSAFVAQVKARNLATVTLKGQSATGELATPIRIAGDRVLGPDESAGAAAAAPVQEVTTTIAEDGQAELVDLLQQYDVPVSIEETGGAQWSGLGLLVATVLPTLVIVGVLLYLGRGARLQQRLPDVLRARSRVADVNRPHVTFADVAGADEAKERLAQVVDFLWEPGKYHALGARLPRGVLLVGPPGTGKTLLAKAVAGEASVPFYSISASEFVEVFVGVGASRVRDLFTQAKAAAPAIVFVDEIDAVGRRRGIGPAGGSEEREQTLNQLLVELDGFDLRQEVVVLAATNRPDVLDPALLRPGRFDRHVVVDLPDRKGREAILRLHAHGVQLAPDVDIGALAAATPGFAGADLANLVNEAALLAARHDEARVGQADLEAALDQIVLGTERSLVLGERERRLVAYHEAGHALVAHLTPGADPIRKISIVARGRALGVTVQMPEEDRLTHTYAELRGRLAVLLGGRSAVELVFGEAMSGAENDLQEATSLARKMVGRWGMSEDIGLLFLGLGEEQPMACAPGEGPSPDLLQRAEAAVGRLLEEAHEGARQLLTMHRDALDRLSEALLREETLDAAAVARLLGAPASAVAHPVSTALPAAVPLAVPVAAAPVA